MEGTILIVDDEKNTREGLFHALEGEFDVYLASNAEEAFRVMKEESFDVILTDLRMAGKSGLKVIEYAMTLPNKPTCIMMTAYGNVETAVEAMKRGAFDFLTKPVNLEKLEVLIRQAIRSRQSNRKNYDYRIKNQSESDRLENPTLNKHSKQGLVHASPKIGQFGIIGESQALSRVLDTINRIAPSKATVLITGETGTGKERIAEIIHQKSPRSNKAFIAVHCAALPASLLESELFGHEKGAFTGAAEKRIGRFEAANEGTLFLDEIGEIDSSVQVKLLRFLESKTFERIGSIKPIQVDVRLIFATNRDLKSMVQAGKFREDLLYRLNVIEIHMPSLRERQSDITLLVEHYIDYFSRENAIQPPRLTNEAMEVLKKYSWPGNIRELRNFCENITILNPNQLIKPELLDLKFMSSTHAPHPGLTDRLNINPDSEEVSPTRSNPYNRIPDHLNSDSTRLFSAEENEKQLIRKALYKTHGNRTEAAKLIGISRRTLHRKLKEWPDCEFDECGSKG